MEAEELQGTFTGSLHPCPSARRRLEDGGNGWQDGGAQNGLTGEGAYESLRRLKEGIL